MDTTTIIAHGLNDMMFSDKAALRSRIWFGFGLYQCGTAKDATAYLGQLRRAIDPDGGRKGAASMAVKTTKIVGERFRALFAAELASEYETPAHMIQACFLAAMASGATSVARLEDWAKHGDPEHRERAKVAAAEAKTAEKSAAIADAQAAIAAAEIAPLGFDVTPVATERAEVTERRSDTWADRVRDLSDADLAALIKAAMAETEARTVKAVKRAS